MCPVCAWGKSFYQPPAGPLKPLQIPQRLWSHIAVDFVTALPPSDGNTTFLMVVDWYSKAVHFIPLSKIPSSMEAGNLLVSYIFRLHGFPRNSVSNWGPSLHPEFGKPSAAPIPPIEGPRKGTREDTIGPRLPRSQLERSDFGDREAAAFNWC